MSLLKFCFVFMMMLSTIQSETSQSIMAVQQPGTDFIPANPVELIVTYTGISTFISCYYRCDLNLKCRTIVSDTTWPFICRLYEGAFDTGTIIFSSRSTSHVGNLLYNASVYANYNQTCNLNSFHLNRFLICNNGLWRCPEATYWNGSICLNDVYYNHSCDTDDTCRRDVGLLCDPLYNKCMCNSTAIWNNTSCEVCSTLYDQCGGENWSGSTYCMNSTCIFINSSYSQCLSASPPSIPSSNSTNSVLTNTTVPTSSVSTGSKMNSTATYSTNATSSTSTSSTSSNSQNCSSVWQQCGGLNWNGPTCCIDSTCLYSNDYYSQCKPTPGSSSSSSSSSVRTTVSSVTESSDNVSRLDGATTRYWDCCKPSCGWSGKAPVTNPVQTCAIDGITPIDTNTQSGCNGGTAFICNNQQPWSVNDTLAYGYAAANIIDQAEWDCCCTCYSLIFTSGPVNGKEMIVQVTNTVDDIDYDLFNLQIPSGGMGYFSGCLNQYNGSYSWGQQYGGISNRTECANLPSAIQNGCYWRFDWFMNADNPTISFIEVPCPTALTAKTSCIRT